MALFDFEDGLFPAVFKNADSQPWVNTTDDSNGGTHSLKSGNAGVDRSTSAFFIIGDFQAGNFTCDYRVSSEDGWDYAYIIVDGVAIVNNQSGNGAWTSMPAHALTAGVHTIQFVYIKDNSAQSGADAFFVDNINLPDFTDLSGQAEYFPSGVPAGWTNDATNPWQAGSKMQTPFAGVESATIGDSTSSTLIYNSDASSPAGAVFFHGRADSEAGDTLKFYIDNVEVYSDEGTAYDNPDHGPIGYYGTVTAGSHEYKWIYTKNASGSAASDTGYVWTFYEPNMAAQVSLETTGTLDGADEEAIRTTSHTVIYTLTNDTFVTGGAFDAQRQAIIDNLTGSSEWNTAVRDNIPVANVVRDSETQITLTVPASSGYSIANDDTIVPVLPAAVLATSATDLQANSSITIKNLGVPGAHIGYATTSGECFVWEHKRGNGTASPISISALAQTSLGAGTDTWCSVSWNGEWIILRSTRAGGAGWDALFIASMSTFPTSLDFHEVTVGGSLYHPSSIHRVSNDGLTIYGVNDNDVDQVSKFTRPNTTAYDFSETTIFTGTAGTDSVFLSLDESYLLTSIGYDFHKVLTSSPYTSTLLFDESTQAIINTIDPSPASDGRVVFEGDGNGGDESIYVLQTPNPSESWTDISGSTGNDNAPFCLANDSDLVASIYLSRPGNAGGDHELIFRDIDGSNETAPPMFYGANIASETFSGFTLSSGSSGVDATGNVTAETATASGVGSKLISANGSVQAGSASASGVGSRIITASGSVNADPASAAGTGSRIIIASGAVTADSAAAAGNGGPVSVVTGSGNPTAEQATASGAGGKIVLAAGAVSADPASVSASGTRLISGNGDVSSDPATAAGAGSVVGVVSASGDVTAGSAVAVGQGGRTILSNGDVSAETATAAGAGSVVGVVAGNGNVTADTAQASGIGTRQIEANGSPVAQQATAQGSGSVVGVVTGTGDVLAEPSSAQGVASKIITGAGNVTAEIATVVAAGLRYVVGTGNVTAETATAYGTDQEPIIVRAKHLIFALRSDSSMYAQRNPTNIHAQRKL